MESEVSLGLSCDYSNQILYHMTTAIRLGLLIEMLSNNFFLHEKGLLLRLILH